MPLAVRPLASCIDGPTLPMMFDISMGVRRHEPEFKHPVDEALTRNRVAIDTRLALPRRGS